MTFDFASVIIKKAFSLSHKKFEAYNDNDLFVDSDSILSIDKVREEFDIDESLEIIGFLDCTDGSQDDERDFAETILKSVDEESNLITITILFDSDEEYQQYYKYLLKEIN